MISYNGDEYEIVFSYRIANEKKTIFLTRCKKTHTRKHTHLHTYILISIYNSIYIIVFFFNLSFLSEGYQPLIPSLIVLPIFRFSLSAALFVLDLILNLMIPHFFSPHLPILNGTFLFFRVPFRYHVRKNGFRFHQLWTAHYNLQLRIESNTFYFRNSPSSLLFLPILHSFSFILTRSLLLIFYWSKYFSAEFFFQKQLVSVDPFFRIITCLLHILVWYIIIHSVFLTETVIPVVSWLGCRNICVLTDFFLLNFIFSQYKIFKYTELARVFVLNKGYTFPHYLFFLWPYTLFYLNLFVDYSTLCVWEKRDKTISA